MKLHAPFVQLPIHFDAERLAYEIRALGESKWRPHPQGFPGNSMLPLVAVDGDAGKEVFAGKMCATPELKACRYLQQVLEAFGATIGRTRLMRLSGRAEVKRHADQNYYWNERVRIHVPIVTHPTVRFECGDSTVNMAVGECWIFDTWRQHRVLNEDDRSRIHLVCDSVGGEGFWRMVRLGRQVGGASAAANWQPRHIAPDDAKPADIAFESSNIPAVMSPWELERHLSFLVDEMMPSPHIEAIRMQVELLYRAWRGLWAQYADAADGEPEYRRLIEQFLIKISPLAASGVLRNELPLLPALTLGVTQAAIARPGSPSGLPGTPVHHAQASTSNLIQ